MKIQITVSANAESSNSGNGSSSSSAYASTHIRIGPKQGSKGGIKITSNSTSTSRNINGQRRWTGLRIGSTGHYTASRRRRR